jgi:ATP/maltotriose-dependent transcriptional regulator MalT
MEQLPDAAGTGNLWQRRLRAAQLERSSVDEAAAPLTATSLTREAIPQGSALRPEVPRVPVHRLVAAARPPYLERYHQVTHLKVPYELEPEIVSLEVLEQETVNRHAREWKTISLVAEGFTNKELAPQLGISEKAVHDRLERYREE